MGIDAQMYGVLKKDITQMEINELSQGLLNHFGDESFFISQDKPLEIVRRVNEIGIFCDEDIIEILPEENEIFLMLSLNGAFYNIGYERGNYPVYKNIAEWIEDQVPGIEIYYGGDSVYPTLFSKELREDLWAHFCEHNNEPYYDIFKK